MVGIQNANLAQKGSNNKGNSNNNQRGNQQRSLLQQRFVSIELLTVLNRENACFSSICNSLILSLNYSFDLLLSSLSLYQLYPNLNYSTLSTITPLQTYQAAPVLASLLRQRVQAKKVGKNVDKNSRIVAETSILPVDAQVVSGELQNTLIGFWDAIVQGTGGVGISTEDITAGFKAIL
jgi:hypothetical protein